MFRCVFKLLIEAFDVFYHLRGFEVAFYCVLPVGKAGEAAFVEFGLIHTGVVRALRLNRESI